MERDAQRLLYLVKMMDGIGPFDFHEMACFVAEKRGRQEANDEDYLAAVRAAIDGVRAT